MKDDRKLTVFLAGIVVSVIASQIVQVTSARARVGGKCHFIMMRVMNF